MGKNLYEKRVILAHNSKGSSSVRAMFQRAHDTKMSVHHGAEILTEELEAAGHITPTAGKLREMKANNLLALLFSFLPHTYGIGAAYIQGWFSHPVNLLWKNPQE